MDKSICVFGDSTAWAAWDTEKGGWVNRLWLSLAHGSEANDYFELYNLSISGGTTETILERFEKEAKVRNANVLIFQTGGNDASQDSRGNFKISPEKFSSNLKEIITKAKTITSEIVFIGFKNVDEARANPVPWADAYYKNSNIEKYDNLIKEICEEEGVLYFEPPKLLESDFADGVHPNSSGHEKIYQSVREFLVSNKIIV